MKFSEEHIGYVQDGYEFNRTKMVNVHSEDMNEYSNGTKFYKKQTINDENNNRLARNKNVHHSNDREGTKSQREEPRIARRSAKLMILIMRKMVSIRASWHKTR